MFYFDVCTGCAVREDSAPFLIGWLAYRLELRVAQTIGTIERGSIPLPSTNHQLNFTLMAKELKERTEIKKKLKKKNDRISFDFSDKLAGQLRRCTADLNRLARIDRIIDKKQTLYSVDTNREAGYIEVIRNY